MFSVVCNELGEKADYTPSWSDCVSVLSFQNVNQSSSCSIILDYYESKTSSQPVLTTHAQS